MPPPMPLGNPAVQAATGLPPGMPGAPQPAPQPKPPNAPRGAPTPPAPAFARGGMAAPPGMPPGAPSSQQQPKGPATFKPNKGVSRHRDGPVPGQSLTTPPKSFPFEQPPKFVHVDDAMRAILNSVTEDVACRQLLGLMEIGVPVSALVSGLLMGGFTEGKWSPDLVLLLSEPVTMLFLKMAEAAGIQPELGVEEDDDRELLEMVAKKRADVSAQQVDAAQAAGLVQRPKPAPRGAR